jgi:zinc transport system substrate-binding protein
VQRRLCEMATCGLLMAGIACLTAGCGRQEQASPRQAALTGKPVVAASVFPLADLAGRVAGDRWDVVCLLPPGRNPHGYSLRPAEAGSLTQAKVLFAAGMGLDGWAIRAARGINSGCKVVVLTEAMGLTDGGQGPEDREQPTTTTTGGDSPPDEADDHEEQGYEHHGMDPHLWLDPELAGRIAELVAAELTREDPAGRGVYEKNLAALKGELAVLDADYRALLGTCRTRKLVVFHPGYGYLAGRYGLEQVPIVAGVGANPGQVEQIIDLVKRDRILAVYREPQFESRWVDFIARQTGAKVLVLDPQGHAGKKGYDSYFAMMRSNLAVLKEGLDCGS